MVAILAIIVSVSLAHMMDGFGMLNSFGQADGNKNFLLFTTSKIVFGAGNYVYF